MIHYTLRCSREHHFDEWFDNSGDFDRKAEAKQIACPSCGDTQVSKAIMAPNVGGSRAADPAPLPSCGMPGGCAGGMCGFNH